MVEAFEATMWAALERNYTQKKFTISVTRTSNAHPHAHNNNNNNTKTS